MATLDNNVPHAGRFCFLFGAGASVPAGIPPMRKMGEEFRARIAAKSPTLGSLFDSVPRSPAYASWYDGNNIEALLFFLYAGADLSRDPSQELVRGRQGFFDGEPIDEATSRRQQQARLCAILALKACSFILGKTSHYDGGRAYLSRLRDFVPGDAALDIFSLNYDTVVEDFCADHQLPCIDGFDADGVWRPQIFYERPAREQHIRLWKLHGSVTWVQDSATKEPRKAPRPGTWDRRVLTGHASSPTTETNLIYPGLGKTAVGPMRLLIDAFKQQLLRADCRAVIAVGYSFADDDLRDLILEVLTRNPNLHLVVISGNSAADHVRRLAADVPQIEPQLQPLNHTIEEALEQGYIQECLNRLTADVRSSRTTVGRARSEEAEHPATGTALQERPDAKPQLSRSLPPQRVLCPGTFKCVRRVKHGTGEILLLTDTVSRNTSRLLAYDRRSFQVDVICTWIGHGSKFTVTRDGIAAIADTKVRDFQFGLGTYWQVELGTADRTPLLSATVPEADELELIARARHKQTSDAEQGTGLEDLGILPWPTAIESLPHDNGFLLVLSAGILVVHRGETADSWQRFPQCNFLNLTIAAHLADTRFLLLETVRGAQGALWTIDINRPNDAPTFLAGGLREPGGLLVLPDKRHILLTEGFPNAKGRLWRVDLHDGCSGELLRDDLDCPGEMALLREDSVAMITRDAVREVPF